MNYWATVHFIFIFRSTFETPFPRNWKAVSWANLFWQPLVSHLALSRMHDAYLAWTSKHLQMHQVSLRFYQCQTQSIFGDTVYSCYCTKTTSQKCWRNIIWVDFFWAAIPVKWYQNVSVFTGVYAGSNPTCCILEVFSVENLWWWSQLEIMLKTFHMSTIQQKQILTFVIWYLYVVKCVSFLQNIFILYLLY